MSIELELLSPARNKDIGIAAINCGADAVYIGGPKFGARQAAGNSIEDIGGLIDYAHKFGAKVYVVVNTILYEEELKAAENFINNVITRGCDALIIQDLGILRMDLLNIPLFASTQTNIRTPEQAKFLASLGFKRLILERGLSLEQIQSISNSTSCDLEAFVHGAICTSYSGQCYLSRRLDGRSANRGDCVQACRSLYDLIDAENKEIGRNKAFLSIKDLRLDNHLQELIESGISSFKIEGRLKNSSYVQNITLWYRRKLDKIIEASQGKYTRASLGRIEDCFEPNPDKTFNRTYTDYFISGERSKWSNMNTQKSLGEKIGTIKEVLYNNNKGCCIRLSSTTSLSNGDGLCILSPKGEIMGTRIEKVENGSILTKRIPQVKKGLPVWRNYDIKFEKSIVSKSPKRLIPIQLDFICKDGSCELIAKDDTGLSIIHTLTNTYGEAKNTVLAQNNIITCLNKKEGDFSFSTDRLSLSPTPFIPMSEINQARRDISTKLSDYFHSLYSNTNKEKKTSKPIDSSKDKPLPPQQQTNLNCSNSLSSSVYQIVGIAPDTSYDLQPRPNAELMRTKLCILNELGLCKKLAPLPYKEPLYLVNNGVKLKLRFECNKCEMVVLG